MRGWDKALWDRLSPLLDRALDLEPAERRRFLADVRRDDPDVAAALEQLLIEHDQVLTSAFLEVPLIAGGVPTSLAGQTVGAYTLERPLGMGGMGMVWLAHRSDGRFEGTVAVKFINLAVLDPVGQERFRREGTLLARLSHPHIAKLLDAGVTPAGQPFLVLESVQGTRIDHFAAEHRLPIDARLALFLQAADAVAHAHANLVVHRDLKPSNILVDAHGQVKLLDFGVAMLIDSGSATEPLTLAGGLALTPEYAAPEQILGGTVTTATDVYALGVLLYQLLVGRRPAATSGATRATILQAIGVEPPRLSEAASRLTADDGESARILAELGTTGDRLRRACDGDLDTILCKALKRDPAERYQTVTAFSDDIARHLRNEPVLARPDRWSYRARKFVRRHRAAVAAGIAVVVALTAAVALTSSEMIEARRQRDRAEFQARRAQASSEFMRHLVTQIGNKPMTMREVLDHGRIALEQQYQGDPAFVARMLMQLSGPYIELGDYKTSAQMMARAHQIASTLSDPDLLAATHCGTAYDLVEQRDFEGARRNLAEAAKSSLRASSPGLNAGCASAETNLALAERRFDDAVRHAETAVKLLEQAGTTTTTRYTSSLDNLAHAYSSAGRLPQALATQRRVTEASRRLGRGETIGVVVSLQDEGVFLRRLGRWLEADRRFREAAELASGADRSSRVPGYLLVNHARLLVPLGRGDEARNSLQRARVQGDLTPTFAAVGQLAEALLHIEEGDTSRARALFDGLHPVEQSALPGTQRHTVTLLAAMIARAEGRLAEAQTIMDRAIEASGFPSLPASTQPELLEYAARLSAENGDFDVSIRRSEDAIRVADSLFGRDVANAHVGRACLTLGMALSSKGSEGAAATALQQAATILEQSAGAAHPWTIEARTRLASLKH